MLTLELIVSNEHTQRIRELAHETGALLFGDFTLQSGKKSDHYFDSKKLTLSPEGAYQVGKAILDELADIDFDLIGGMAIGSVPIVTAVSLVSYQEGRPIPAFIVRPQLKEHGTRNKIEGQIKEGSRVVIVDDVTTTGESVMQVIRAVEAIQCKVVKVIAIVDRNEGGRDLLKSHGYNFYGLMSLEPSGKLIVNRAASITNKR